MKEKFLEMMKKGRAVKDGPYKDAKLSMLKELMKVMDDGLLDDVKGIKQVTVAAPSEEGLEEGLEKAQDIVKEMPEMEEESEEAEMEDSEDDEIEMLEKKLAELKAKKMA